MTLLDKVIAAVTPTESSDRNMDARRKARAAAGPTGWFAQVLQHHEQIEQSLAAVREAGSATARRSAQKQLGLVLTAHSIAEEAVLYPAMANADQKGNATELYAEQAAAKVQMAALDELDPMSQDYLDKLEHIRGALAHHIAEEEGDSFLELAQSADAALNGKLTRLYRTEFERYMGVDDKLAA